MSRRKTGLLASLVTACVAISNISGAQAACDDLSAFNAAVAARDLALARTTEARMAADASCSATMAEARRQRAVLEFSQAEQLRKASAGEPPASYEELLTSSSAVLWYAASTLGDVRLAQKRYADATTAYERALEIIKNPTLTPTAPDQKSIKAIFDSAVSSRMLAAESGGVYVSASKDHRDGTIGGVFSPEIRGMKVVEVPLPIQFDTASAELTEVGRSAAAELLTALQQQAPKRVVLVGHTDERGADDYNMRLSAARVKTVADYLKGAGVAAEIVTIAKGKSEPLPIDQASGFSKDQILAMNRRVVWQRE